MFLLSSSSQSGYKQKTPLEPKIWKNRQKDLNHKAYRVGEPVEAQMRRPAKRVAAIQVMAVTVATALVVPEVEAPVACPLKL